MTRLSDQQLKLNELIGRLLNEDIDAASAKQLNDMLAGDIDAQMLYVRHLDLEAAVRQHARLIDDDDFAVLQAQAALDAQPAGLVEGAASGGRTAEPSRNNVESRQASPQISGAIIPILDFASRRPWQRISRIAAAAVMLIAVTIILFNALSDRLGNPENTASKPSSETIAELVPAHLSGTVGARWAGEHLELPEGEQFKKGQRIELIEGLADVHFQSGARLIVQGPAILLIRDETRVQVLLGRIAATVGTKSPFTIQTATADLTSRETEFGARSKSTVPW